MNSADVQVRRVKAADYLSSIGSLGDEFERAMQAIAHNALSDLEESISNQQVLSSRLGNLAEALSGPLDVDVSIPEGALGDDFARQIRAAASRLQNLNRCYAALLRHSSRCTGQMTSLFQSYQGRFQEASGSGSKHRTWSCQM